MGKDSTLYFIDFDGVICDSALEGFVSSEIAYTRLTTGTDPDRCSVTGRDAFYRMRPFIRNGEDFLLLQEYITAGREICSQQEFDAALSARGAERMQQYRQAIYRVRQELVGNLREYWIHLNRIYPEVEPVIREAVKRQEVFILSTKQSDLIAEILSGSRIAWPKDRIITSLGQTKEEVITERMNAANAAHALFVDDQPDHLLSPEASLQLGITCYLAAWGYVRPEWLEKSSSPVLHASQLSAVLG